MRLLHIRSSILGQHSASGQVSDGIVERFRTGRDHVEIIRRDLSDDTLPHLTLANLPSQHPLTAQFGDTASADRAESDSVLQEFLDADVVVVGAPMYNFTIPSQLKAWIDRIVIPGVTFRYGANGPEGLAVGKRVIVVPARGGFYGQGSPAAAFEHQETYLRTVFGFIGVTDLDLVVVEGLAGGPDAKSSAMDRAAAASRELRLA